ncbi:MAG: tRNA (adenosine(37)-N6)-threonylcarbamoyltransferase complex ATPase subunit type 1 TsaE [Candidatus Cloacimonadia bacterium]
MDREELVREYLSHSPKTTEKVAANFAHQLAGQESSITALIGPLGSGKTFFVQHAARSLGAKGYISSPSFKILNQYDAKIPIFHFDFYRLKNLDEIINIGFFDFLSESGIFFIEWPEKFLSFLPTPYYKITFKIIDKNSRRIAISKIIR